jgi:hypothetical protein
VGADTLSWEYSGSISLLLSGVFSAPNLQFFFLEKKNCLKKTN